MGNLEAKSCNLASFKSELKDLVEKTKSYLEETYPKEGALFVDAECKAFFKEAKGSKTNQRKTALQEAKPPPIKEASHAKEAKEEAPFKLPPPTEKEPAAQKESAPSATLDYEDIKQTFQRLYPNISLSEPKEVETKRASVFILYRETLESHIHFFQEIQRAIDTLITPCACINLSKLKERGLERIVKAKEARLYLLESLSLVDYALFSQHFVKKEGSPKTCFLGNTPTYPIEDLTLLMRSSEKKRELWAKIKELLS